MKKREEESALSLAENKLSIHKELEEKESQIKILNKNILQIQKENDNLHRKSKYVFIKYCMCVMGFIIFFFSYWYCIIYITVSSI